MPRLIDYSYVDNIWIIGVEVSADDYHFVVKERQEGKAPREIGFLKFNSVNITVSSGFEDSVIAEIFLKAINTPDILTPITLITLRSHPNWEDVQKLVEKEANLVESEAV